MNPLKRVVVNAGALQFIFAGSAAEDGYHVSNLAACDSIGNGFIAESTEYPFETPESCVE